MKITGFKSFGDRTRLELEPGVTVVVGPNGSGKSNIVDSIAWVLGTQSTKSLRTEKMDDVIFAGTATRPALQRAEVVLVFDNSSGTAPLDVAEVTVTRRLYRDGSSEYEINGVGCRLLDVQELLSDSGVGRHQHVVVGQGQLDAILNAKPEDHRAVIEEAAGVLKHRLRKDRSLRRLERTEADVLRVLDIVKELGRQLRPLRRQADDAARYDGVKGEIVALRLFLGGEELRRIDGRLAAVSAEDAELAEAIRLAAAELGALDGRLPDLTEAAGDAGAALDRDTAAAARLETVAERLRSIAQVAAERSRGLRARLEGADERRQDLQDEQQELEVDLTVSVQRQAESAEQVEVTERLLNSLEDEERSLAEQEQMPTEGAVAIVRGDLRALQAAAERDASEIRTLNQRLDTLEAQSDVEQADIERLGQEIERLDGEATAAQMAYQSAQAERVRHQASWEQSQDAHRESELALAAARARLEAMQAAVEGLTDPAAREFVTSDDAWRGPLVAALDIPPDLSAAVDAALGTWADGHTLDRPDSVSAVVAELKRRSLGGVPLVARVLDPGEMSGRRVADATGLDALVDALGVNADPGLAGALLGDVVLAEGWTAGYEVAQRYPEVRVVTPEGDIITHRGIRVAHPHGASPAMVESADAAAADADDRAARARSLATSSRRTFDDAREEERRRLETLEMVEARLAGATEHLDRRSRTREQITEEAVRLRGRVETITAAGADRDEHIERLRERLAALEGEEAERQAAWEQLARRRQDVARQRDEARRARQQAAAEHGAVVERRAMVERRLAAVRVELAQLRDHPVEPEKVDALETTERRARAAGVAVNTHIEALRARQVTLRQEAGEAGERLASARQRREELQSVIGSGKDRLSRLAVEAAELRVRRESVAEGLRRDVDSSEAEALSAPQPEYEEPTDLVERLATLEADLRRMGPVNPLAASEFREINQRYEHIQAQLDDLNQAKAELQQVISGLDQKIEELFMEAFAEVAAHYEQHFSILFPGGRGKLVLTDPNDLLETGVDIKAQPLGKKVSRLQLLSGGERSLAALAFLFAVFKARPSPFYILDEVEAALDDANLRRFLSLIDDFRGAAQLVIVTHQQQTMEAADVLYGVTMEPGGSSKVIAKRMSGQLVLDET